MDIYQKLAAQYNNSQKPVVFQYKTPASSVRQRKFGVITDRIRRAIENGLDEKYLQASEEDDYYWNFLVELFKDYKNDKPNLEGLTEEKLRDKQNQNKWWEIHYVEDQMHLPMTDKVRQWIVLLLADHKIFQVLEVIMKTLQKLFKDEEYGDSAQYKQIIGSVDFLKDYQFNVTCDLISNYEEYCIERKQRQFLQGLEEIKAIRNKKQSQRQRELQIIEKNKNISLALFNMIMRQIKIIKDKEQQERIKLQNKLRRQQLQKQKNKPQLADYEARRPTTFVQSVADFHLPTPGNNFHTNQLNLKKSEKLYREQFQELQKQFQFDLQPEQSQNKTQCADCKSSLSMGLYILGKNQNYCYYTGKWYCNECIAPERIAIPWKALKTFDLRGYTVCKKAFNDIHAYYDKAVIQIPLDALVIQRSRILFEFLVVKRQIHLMYDSICNIQLMEGVLRKKLNYCLKQNLFSLHNLYNIYNNTELPNLQQNYSIFARHFNQCDLCLKKGYICKICNKPDRIFPFQLRQTKGCMKCKKLYHINCLRYKPCICSNK